MNQFIECKTQKDLEKCCKNGDIAIVREGEFTACGSSQVRAYGSSQVRACGSSQVRAYDSSQVTAYDSSQVRAYDSSQVRACGSSQVTAYGYVAVTQHGNDTRIKVTKTCALIKVPPTKGLTDYLNRYPIEKSATKVILYKAVQPDLQSFYSTKIQYPESGMVELEGKIDPPENGSCAHGLHFSHFDWAVGFGQGFGKFVILKAEINKKAIIVSPDCDGKVRCSKAKIIEVIRDWQHYQPKGF
jgi:hypothetical protein